MQLNTSYRVRILFDDGHEHSIDNLDWDYAKQRFAYYVNACLEFDGELHVRCINIFRGKNCLRYYQNYALYEKRGKNPLLK